jgi:hypothetical protein
MLEAEANKLAGIHGEAYQVYRQTTPALLPSLKHFHDSDETIIRSRALRRGLFDTFWFFASLDLMHIFAELHHSGRLPAWYILP